MAFRFTFLCLVLLSGLARSQKQPVIKSSSNLRFTIGTSWKGDPILSNETVNIILRARDETREIGVKIDAPFYDDPAPQHDPQKPFLGLWNYEVVQLFFLNDEDQYLELEIGPHGQQIVLLMDGQRNTIRHSLPLNVTSTIEGSRWRAKADIPLDYFPRKVAKFNAYALHGVGSDRKYLALYPESNPASEPDMHNLASFQPIDFGGLGAIANENDFSSELWQNAMQGIFSYVIHRQWNNFRTRIPPTEVTLQGFEGGVEINFTIPNNEKPYPSEALVIAFENEKGEAMKLRMHVDGSYFVDFLVERKTRINAESFPLDYRVDSSNADHVKGSALVPPSYFPPGVKLMNIYALFGMESMIALTLKPIIVVEDVAFTPDLNSIKHFTPIDFDLLVESNVEYSSVWKQMLNLSEIKEEIEASTLTTPVLEGEIELETSTSPVEITTTLQSDAATTSSATLDGEINLDEKFEPTTHQPLVETEIPSAIFMHEKDIGYLIDDILRSETDEEKDILKDFLSGVTEAVTDEPTQTTLNTENPQNSYTIQTTQSSEASFPTKITFGRDTFTTPEILTSTDAAPITELPSTERTLHITTSQTQGKVKTYPKPSEISDTYPKTSETSRTYPKTSETAETYPKTSETSETYPKTPETSETHPKTSETSETSPETSETSETKPSNFLSRDSAQTSLDIEPSKPIKGSRSKESLEPRPKAPLRFLLRRRPKEPKREQSPRRYEDPKSDYNELPITFQLVPRPKSENAKVPSSPQDVASKVEKDKISVDYQLEEETPSEVDRPLVVGLLPPPHPICFAEGLVRDSFRCQIFYECVIEEGDWVVYRWRCKRGFFYDPETVACVRGFC